MEKILTRNLSVGILLYKNTKREIFDCLDSLIAQSAANTIAEIILRDQSGECKSYVDEWLEDHPTPFPVVFMEGSNLGFGGGHNAIFKAIRSNVDGYICLNPDGIMHPEALREMLMMAERHKWRGLFEAIQEPVMHPKEFDGETGITAWCSAACILIPKTIFERVSGFDEDFFMYCEDVDFSWRVKAVGYQCYTVKTALFHHYAMDRGGRQVDIWRSACLLGHKWHASEFKENALKILTSLIDVEAAKIRTHIESHKQCPIEMVFRASPDFRNNLVFAKPMWN